MLLKILENPTLGSCEVCDAWGPVYGVFAEYLIAVGLLCESCMRREVFLASDVPNVEMVIKVIFNPERLFPPNPFRVAVTVNNP